MAENAKIVIIVYMREIISKGLRPLIDDVKRNIKTDSMGHFNLF